MSPVHDMTQTLRTIFDAVVAAAHPANVLAAHLPPAPKGRIIILGAGKAGASMAAAAVDFYRSKGINDARLVGVAVARDGYGCAAGPIEVIEAGHPLPNAAGLEATRRVLDFARSAGPDDLVLALISGGGSANWLLPRGDITLADKQAVTKALLRSGAGIGEINCVRKHLSEVKGGRLAVACGDAKLVTLAISDVPGDDPSVIASGPTVPDPTTLRDALDIVRRRGIDLPESCRCVLEDATSETPKPNDPVFARQTYTIIATPASAMAAGAAAAEAMGYRVERLATDLEGEARDVAREHALLALDAKRLDEPVALISGGELTVTISGEGRGGPNQEYALALAIALDGEAGIEALSADTDGTDGGTGLATDPAGAFIGPGTLSLALSEGIDATASLSRNDSTGFFERIGGLFAPGPTMTNVNDCRVILVG